MNSTAHTILDQLGGSKFLTMTGAYNLVKDENSLTMKLRRNKAKASHLRITLNADDTYHVEFIKATVHDITTKAEFNTVYADQLKNIYETTTGQYTSL